MKKPFIILMTFSMVAVGWVSVAFCAPYISGNVGAVWVEDSDFSDSAGGISVDGDFSFDTGFGITAAIGNDFGNGLRAEIELGYRDSDIDELDATVNDYGFVYSGSASIDGDVSATSLMANGFYEFMSDKTVSPFIGGGIGFANVEGDSDALGGDDDDNVFAYQGIVGIAFALNPQIKLDVQYRYFATDDPELGGTDFEYASNNAMIGLRFSF